MTGAAIDHMFSTRRLLELVFSDNRDDELITTPARREILREHLYRELTKGTYTAGERKLWADRLQRLLDGSVTTDLRCHLIDVRLGVDSSSLNNMKVVAHEGGNAVPVEITELNERQIEVLIPTEPPEPEPEAEEGGEGGEPEPPTGEQPPTAPGEPDEPPSAPSDAVVETPEPDSGTAVPERMPEQTAAAPVRPRARLGTAPGEYGKPREIWFDPGAAKCLARRPGIAHLDHFGSDRYSREELVTEMSKAMLRAETGIDTDAVFENSAAYIDSWLGALKGDKKVVVSAAAAAQRAAEYVTRPEAVADRVAVAERQPVAVSDVEIEAALITPTWPDPG